MTWPVPPVWTREAQSVITPTTFGSVATGEIGFSTVIKAQGRLSSPIDAWYLWCAPHDEPGGIYLATAPAPAGPWTKYQNSAVLLKQGSSHISSPYVLWNPNTSKLMMWVHERNGTPSTQKTYLYESANGSMCGINWTLLNDGNPVLQPDAEPYVDSGSAAYLGVYWDGSQFVGYYTGVVLDSVDDARVCRATSPDGITWTKDVGIGNGALWTRLNTVSEYQGKALPLAGGDIVYYRNSPKPAWAWWRARNPVTGEWSLPRYAGLGLGVAGATDDQGAMFSEFVYDAGKFYGFYMGLPNLADDLGRDVSVASCTYPQSGFDTTWGKG